MSFIRKIKTKSGIYQAEVESYREDGKVKQRVVQWLGKVEKPMSRASRLAGAVSLIEQGCSEIESLAEEITTWHDNMSGTNLENTEKYRRLEECASQLQDSGGEIENIVGILQDVDIPTMFG